MLEKHRKNTRENEAEFAATALLMNILLFAVIGGAVWTFYVILTKADAMNAFMRGGFLS